MPAPPSIFRGIHTTRDLGPRLEQARNYPTPFEVPSLTTAARIDNTQRFHTLLRDNDADWDTPYLGPCPDNARPSHP